MAARYRCTACGNLTRFDVTATSTTRSFHHYTVGGELDIESVEVLATETTDVRCHWCNAGLGVVVEEGTTGQSEPGVPLSEPAG